MNYLGAYHSIITYINDIPIIYFCKYLIWIQLISVISCGVYYNLKIKIGD